MCCTTRMIRTRPRCSIWPARPTSSCSSSASRGLEASLGPRAALSGSANDTQAQYRGRGRSRQRLDRPVARSRRGPGLRAGCRRRRRLLGGRCRPWSCRKSRRLRVNCSPRSLRTSRTTQYSHGSVDGVWTMVPSTLNAQYPSPACSVWPLRLKRRWCRQPGHTAALSSTVALQCGQTRVAPGLPVRGLIISSAWSP